MKQPIIANPLLHALIGASLGGGLGWLSGNIFGDTRAKQKRNALLGLVLGGGLGGYAGSKTSAYLQQLIHQGAFDGMATAGNIIANRNARDRIRSSRLGPDYGSYSRKQKELSKASPQRGEVERATLRLKERFDK